MNHGKYKRSRQGKPLRNKLLDYSFRSGWPAAFFLSALICLNNIGCVTRDILCICTQLMCSHFPLDEEKYQDEKKR